jgi:hypothetical protein
MNLLDEINDFATSDYKSLEEIPKAALLVMIGALLMVLKS